MNVKEYISSGILESFVLGELSPQEEQEVLAMAEKHAEVREELDQIEKSFEQVAIQTAVKAPASVKESIMSSIEPAAEAKTIPLPPPKQERSLYRYVAAASILLALVSSFLAWRYWNNWREAEAELSTLIAENQQIADNYNQVNEKLDGLARDLEILGDPAFSRISLAGTENSPESSATVYWDESSEQVYLRIKNLASLSRDQQYQLWAIIDGLPVDAGVFDVSDGLITMKNIPEGATAFAITVEPSGGSREPSLETMRVIGNVTSG